MAWDDLTWVSHAEVHIYGHRRHLETQWIRCFLCLNLEINWETLKRCGQVQSLLINYNHTWNWVHRANGLLFDPHFGLSWTWGPQNHCETTIWISRAINRVPKEIDGQWSCSLKTIGVIQPMLRHQTSLVWDVLPFELLFSVVAMPSHSVFLFSKSKSRKCMDYYPKDDKLLHREIIWCQGSLFGTTWLVVWATFYSLVQHSLDSISHIISPWYSHQCGKPTNKRPPHRLCLQNFLACTSVFFSLVPLL